MFMAEGKRSRKIKYKHRALYVFFVLLAINLLWDLLFRRPGSFEHFAMGIVMPAAFALFYLIVKNIRKIYAPKKEKKTSFTGSVVFIPFVYAVLVFVSVSVFALYDAFIYNDKDPANNTAASTQKINTASSVDGFDYIVYTNFFVCKAAQIPAEIEFPAFVKTFYNNGYLSSQNLPKTRIIIITTLACLLFQLISVILAEKVIYPRTKKKKKIHRKKFQKPEERKPFYEPVIS